MAKLRSKTSTHVAEVTDRMMSQNEHCTIAEIANAILDDDDGGLWDEEAERWKLDSIKRQVKAYLKKKSSWVGSCQMALPNVLVDQPLPSAINVPQSIFIDQEEGMDPIEVIENQWISIEKATLAEMKQYRLMLRQNMMADGRKMNELEVWIDYLENHSSGDDEVSFSSIIASISEQVA